MSTIYKYRNKPTWTKQVIEVEGNLPPLSNVHWFDDPGDLVDEGDSSSDVVKSFDVSYLLPRHRHVL